MSYVYNLADINYKTAVFYENGSWIKPQGITMVSITAIGAGGGGGGGLTGTNAQTRTGGPGGGSGAITRIIIPEMFISDSLIINIGIGGNGATTASGNGGNGGDTSIDMPVRGNGDIYTRIITASGGTGGNGGSNTAGVGGTVAAIANSIYSSLGIWFATAGDSGDAGANGAGNGLTYGRSGIPITGGAGGGGMVAGVITPTQPGWIAGNLNNTMVAFNTRPVAGGNGDKGTFSLTPFYSTGGNGGGGGGNTPLSGGIGGEGNIGCGGGGGGGGTSPTGTGAGGGRGGDGLVIIQCW